MTIETAIKEFRELVTEDGPDGCRRLLRVQNELWVYGGGSAIMINDRKVCHWAEADTDDDVRAVAVSEDRTAVVIGFETGSTNIYKYEASEVLAGSDDNEQQQQHPFGLSKPKNCKSGPTFSAAMRDLQFYPGSSTILAVASEDGLCVLDLSSDTQELILEQEAAKHHNGNGVRSVAFSPSDNIMVSLDMEGRLCFWNVADPDPHKWTLLQRETNRCITKKDLGEYNGSDAWDRACRPVFLQDSSLLALPGETYLQMRKVKDSKVTATDLPYAKGHIETVVALTSRGSYLVSTGRDNRVVLWSIKEVCFLQIG